MSAASAALGVEVEMAREYSEVIVLGKDHELRGPPTSGSKVLFVSGAANRWEARAVPMAGIVEALSERFDAVVIDESGCGGTYDVALQVPTGGSWKSDAGLQAVSDQLQLRLTRTKRVVPIVRVVQVSNEP
ncbi:MAG: DUF3738 domain-containing protein [Phycisphaeraceae bacterium]|nr:DUF3738 domain-containing protein [Phycisphaeraceae bacterium]